MHIHFLHYLHLARMEIGICAILASFVLASAVVLIPVVKQLVATLHASRSQIQSWAGIHLEDERSGKNVAGGLVGTPPYPVKSNYMYRRFHWLPSRRSGVWVLVEEVIEYRCLVLY